MIRTLFISSALIASSAAAAVALATLHDAAGNDVARIEPTQLPEAAPVVIEERFVIPTYAPAQRVEEEVASVPAAPVTPEPVSVPEVQVEQDMEPTVVPFMYAPGFEIKETKTRPATTKPRAAKPRVAKVRVPQEQPRRAKSRPVIVAQAPAFMAGTKAATQPDYLIGVYR